MKISAIPILLFIILFFHSFAFANYEGKSEESISGEYLAAEFSIKNNDLDGATEYYIKAFEKDSDNKQILLNIYKYQLLSGNYEAAYNYAQEYLKYEPDSLSALFVVVNSLVAKGDFNSAAGILSNMSENNKNIIGIDQVILPFIRMWVAAGTGSYDLAENMLDPHDNKPIVTQSFIDLQKGLLLSLSGDKEGAAAKFSNILNEKGVLPYHLVRTIGTFYENNNEWEKARTLYTRYKAQHKIIPQLEDDVIRISKKTPAKLYINSPSDAISEVMKEAARLLYNSNIYSEGLFYLRLALQLRPNDDEALMLLASYYEEANKYDKAIEAYNKINPKDDLYVTSQSNIAENLYKQGNVKEAEQRLKTIADNIKDKYIPLLTLADLLRKDGKYKEAIEFYTKAIEYLPSKEKIYWGVFFSRGTCYERLKDWKNAEADLLKALELYPNQPEVMNYLAYSWVERNENLEKAKEMLLKAVARRPDDPQIIDSAGWALYKMKKYDNAAIFLEKALETLPQDPVLNDHLGDIYWKQGRFYEAKYQWQRAIKYGPAESSTEIRLKKKILSGLEG